MNNDKRVLLAGGVGFIGSHFCDLLLAEGFTVICMDSLLTGLKKNIRQHLGNSRFSFIQQDISQRFELEGALDYVLNLASPASPADYSTYPIETLRAGSLGTLNTLELARDKQAKYLLASTSEVYGDPEVSPQTEAYWGHVNPVGERSCYDEAKRFSEALTMAYHRVHKVDIKIARIFNAYGPRMRKNDGRVVPNFIMQALGNKAITIFGKGSQTRSFCYVSDMVNGLYKLMLSNVHGPINIGNPNEITVLELAKEISDITGKELKIEYRPLPKDDPKLRRPDISKAINELSWSPDIDLRQGLIKTIDWFKKK